MSYIVLAEEKHDRKRGDSVKQEILGLDIKQSSEQ